MQQKTTVLTGKPDEILSIAGKTYEDGFNDALKMAEEKLIDLDVIANPALPLTSVAGEVKDINNGILTVEFDAQLFDVFAEGVVTKQVRLAEGAFIEKNTLKTPEQIEKELSEVPVALDPDDEENNLIDPYYLEQLTVSDLKVGDYILFEADVDVKAVDEFEAVAGVVALSPGEAIPDPALEENELIE